MTIPLLQVDAFASKPFSGNPAGVCLLGTPASAEWMQAVASEMNLSETAFLVRRGVGSFDLRWFTPAVEIELCGHATLASAHAIWERGIEPPSQELEFSTASGPLHAQRLQEGWIELDFPAEHMEAVGPGSPRRAEALAIAAALGVPLEEAAVHGRNWIVLAASAAAVRAAAPHMSGLAELGRMISLTAASDGVLPESATLPAGRHDVDFVSRVFVPALGIPEDPVTGSAHCALGPFWAARLERDEMAAFQASARGGVVGVRVAGDRVCFSGQAVTVIEGELRG